MAEYQNLALDFPIHGVDVSGAFLDQPANTAAVGINVRSIDPILERLRGGSRPGLSKYGDQIPEGTFLIQHLNQIVLLRDDNLLANWDFEADYIDDPRNSDRKVPPRGSGSTPSKNWPPDAYRRIRLVASHTIQTNGQNVILTATLWNEPGDVIAVGQTITFSTDPTGQDGMGDSGVTNVSGQVSITVNEATFNGRIVYFASHQYYRSGQVFPSVARGIVTVIWKPNYTLTLESPEGNSFLADGKTHPLVGSLVNTSTLLPVSGKQIELSTLPLNRVGAGQIRITNLLGRGTWRVSSLLVEEVDYTATLLPQKLIDSNTVTIEWTAPAPPDSCNTGILGTPPAVYQDGENIVAVGWFITWTSNTIPPTVPTTHIKMVMATISGNVGYQCGEINGLYSIPDPADYDVADSTCGIGFTPPVTGEDLTAKIAQQTPDYTSFLADLQANACA